MRGLTFSFFPAPGSRTPARKAYDFGFRARTPARKKMGKVKNKKIHAAAG